MAPPLIRKYLVANKNLYPIRQSEEPCNDVHTLWAAIVVSATPHLREHLPTYVAPPPAEGVNAYLLSSIRAALPQIGTLGEDLVPQDHITLYRDITTALQSHYPLTDDNVTFDLVYTRQCNYCKYEQRTGAQKSHIHLTINDKCNGEDIQQLLTHDPLLEPSTCQACGKHTTKLVSTEHQSPLPPLAIISLTRPLDGTVSLDVLQQITIHGLQYQLRSVLRASPTGWTSQFLDLAGHADVWRQGC